MTNLLSALANVSNGLIVPIRKSGKISINASSYIVDHDVDEKCYLTMKDGIFVIRNINDFRVQNINSRITLIEMTKCDNIFGKPLCLGTPKASFVDEQVSFIEFINLATHKPADIKNLIVGFVVGNVMYAYDYNLSLYDLTTGEEKDIRDENIPVSLLVETGNIVYINGGEIHNFNELDFDMLKEFGMC